MTEGEEYTCKHCNGVSEIKVLKETEKATEPTIEFCPFCGMSNEYPIEKDVQQLDDGVSWRIGPPVAMDVTHLRYLNKIITPFYTGSQNQLSIGDLRRNFRSGTSYGVYKRLSEDFELIVYDARYAKLTKYGIRFRGALNTKLMQTRASMPDLSNAQKRVLLEVLTNGNLTKCKVNIYYFLRFVRLTGGEWLPKTSTRKDGGKLEFVNSLFGTSYVWNTASEFLSFTCNQCEELNLASRMKFENSTSDKVVLTPLGSRILGFLELYLRLKREQIQIPLSI